MRELFEKTAARLGAGETVVWCVILAAEGSTPRGVGAKMAVFSDGTSYGTIGGGAVEYEAIRFALSLPTEPSGAHKQSAIRSFDLYSGGSEATGMVCGGSVTVGFLPFPPYGVESFEGIDWTRDHWLILDVDEAGGFGICAGCDLIPDPAESYPHIPFVETLPNGRMRLIEPMFRSYRVWIFGAGHVSAALVPVLEPLGFPMTVIDPRPELARAERFPGAAVLCGEFEPLPEAVNVCERDYAVVMTPGHEKDLAVLRQVLRTPASYIGCIGSRKKTAYVNQKLREEGFSELDLARIHAPIGLPIKARTPEEIAISIAAELILHRAEHPQ